MRHDSKSECGSKFTTRSEFTTRSLFSTAGSFGLIYHPPRPDTESTRLKLSGLPNTNAKSQRFSYAITQIAALPPVVALNRSFESQIAARYAAFWHTVSQIALTSFL